MDAVASVTQDSTGSETSEAIVSSPRPALTNRLALLASRAALAAAVLLLVGTAGLYVFRTSYADKIYPSVYVQGAEIGGMTYSDAKSAIEAESSSLLASEVTFTYGQQRWSATLQELGVSLDVARTLDCAYLVGRESDARDRVDSTLSLVNKQRTVPLSFSLNEQAFNTWFTQVDVALGRPSQDAGISVVDGRIDLVEDRDGLVVDRQRARLLVVSSLQSSTAFAGPLPTVSDPAAVHVSDLAPLVMQLDAALSDSIKLAYGKDRWRLTSVDLGQFVVQAIDSERTGADAVAVT